MAAAPISHGVFPSVQPFPTTPFVFQALTRKEGAPENSFYAVAVDAHHRLALGMINGASVFNGTRFQRVDLTTDSPRGNTAYAIAAGDGDDLFVATPAGFFARHAGQWRHLTKDDGLPHTGVNHVRFVHASRIYGRDVVYVSTQGGVAVLASDSLAIIDLIDPAHGLKDANVYASLEIADGPGQGLWLGGPWGLARRLEKEKFAIIYAPPTDAQRAIRGLYFDRHAGADTVWAGSEAGLVRITPGRTPVVIADLANSAVASIVRVERGHGESWLCAGRLLQGFSCQSDDGAWQHFAVATEASASHVVFSLAVAGTANGADVLWLATDAGLVRAIKPAAQHISGGPDLLSQRIDGLLPAADGRLWVTTGSQALRIDWPRWSLWHPPGAADDIRSIGTLSGENGGARVALGVDSGKIYVFDGERQTRLGFEPGEGRSVQDFAQARDPAGAKLWVGVNGALWSWDGHSAESITPASGIRSLWVSKLLATPRGDNQDDLWVGLNSTGLSHRAKGVFKNLEAKDGVAADENVTCLHADSHHALWVGLQAGGARRLWPLPDPTQVTRFSETTHPALPDGTINSIASDHDGRVYLCTNRGISRVQEHDGTFSVRTFNREDGMPDDECSMNAGATDAQGRVFFGTMHGLVFIDPSAVDETPPPVELMFESATYADNRSLSDGEKLAHDQNNLAFDFALVTHTHAHEVTYETHLIGAEAHPVDWRPDLHREFTGLSAGDYRFSVRARDHTGREYGPIERSFTIRAPPWATPWAYGGYLLSSGMLVFAAMRTRLRVLRRRAEQLEVVVETRTEEVRKQADELRKQSAELLEKNSALIESQKQADRIFSALKQAMPGTILAEKYLLGEMVGEGGFGAVYRATEVRSGEQRAAKVFKPKAGNDSPESLERFKREAVSSARVNHPNAVKIFDGGVNDDGLPFIILELLKGHGLDQELKDKTKLSVARTLQLVLPVCDVLSVAHAQNIIHRDIKPENIFLHRENDDVEIVKVLDFGIAKLQEDVASSSLTVTGAVVGTPYYMSPERVAGQLYDGRSDVYAVGVMLYECLTGRLPFISEGGNIFSVMVAQLNKPPPLLTEFDPTIPAAVQDVVLAALVKDPLKRPDAESLAHMLRQLADARNLVS